MQPSKQDDQLAELMELLDLAKVTEEKSQELADLILGIDQKYEKRLAEIRVSQKILSDRPST